MALRPSETRRIGGGAAGRQRNPKFFLGTTLTCRYKTFSDVSLKKQDSAARGAKARVHQQEEEKGLERISPRPQCFEPKLRKLFYRSSTSSASAMEGRGDYVAGGSRTEEQVIEDFHLDTSQILLCFLSSLPLGGRTRFRHKSGLLLPCRVPS